MDFKSTGIEKQRLNEKLTKTAMGCESALVSELYFNDDMGVYLISFLLTPFVSF